MTPGHNETHVAFYDGNTGLFFSGDFLMPGRLLIDDTDADLASAKRAAAFAQDRPITAVLGGHIETNAAGETFTWGSQYHPDEHVLQLTKDDPLASADSRQQLQWLLHHERQVHHAQLHVVRPGRSVLAGAAVPSLIGSRSCGGLSYSASPATEISRRVAADLM